MSSDSLHPPGGGDDFVRFLREDLSALPLVLGERLREEIIREDSAIGARLESISFGSGDPARQDLRLGKMVDHFAVLRHIGQGGMGVVYRAADIRLRRFVALKFLPSLESGEGKSRFMREARAASRLDHPNICTVHEIGETSAGQPYIAMAFFDGETVGAKIEDDPLDEGAVVSIAKQVLSGLTRAHDSQVVHRDIKPGNLMVLPDGTLKILDFGVAQLPADKLTQQGQTVGTVAYMSPEQVRGEPVDGRSDLWSLGVTLYECLAGNLPFRASYQPALMYTVLHEPPERFPTHVSRPVRDFILRCLEKEASNRYQTAPEALLALNAIESGTYVSRSSQPHQVNRPRSVLWAVLAVLAVVSVWWITSHDTPPSQPGRGLAVLPFSNALGADPDNQALADGLTRSVASMVSAVASRNPDLWVVPASEIEERGIASPSQAQRVFNVQTVLTGSVQRVGGDLELSIYLEDPAGPRTIDARTILQDTPGFRDSVEVAVRALLTGASPEPGNANVAARESSEAYIFYVRGLGYLRRHSEPGSLDRSEFFFDEALRIEPTYALATAGLCESYVARYLQSREASWLGRALEKCNEAVLQAPDESGVRVTQARLLLASGQFREAEREIRQALVLDSLSANAHRWLGRILEDRANIIGATEAYQTAIALDPALWTTYDEIGILYLYSGQNDKAAEAYRAIIRLAPDYYDGYNGLAVAQRNLGEPDSARTSYRKALTLQDNALSHRGIGSLAYRERDFEQAEAAFRAACAVDSVDIWNWALLSNALYWRLVQQTEIAGPRNDLLEVLTRVENLAEGRISVNPRDGDALLLRTFAMALGGATAEARQSLLQLLSVPIKNDYSMQYVARIYQKLDETDLALTYVLAAVDAGMTVEVIESDPWFDSIRSLDAYQEVRSRMLDKS